MCMKKSLLVFPALAIAVTLAGIGSVSSADSTATVEKKSTTTTIKKKKKVTTTTLPPKGTSTGVSALSLLLTITVENERSSGYSRSLFTHWIDADGDSCNTREEVLIAESKSKAQVDAYGCKVIEGDWLSPYDNQAHTNPSELDIDHMVPLKEAWDSGAWAWSASQRKAFANDLSDDRSLIAVTAGQNRSKGEKDPSNWLPPEAGYRCTYLGEWVAIKSRWKLSMDQSEFGRIKNVLTASCASTTIAPWGSKATASGSTETVAPAGDSAPVVSSPTPTPTGPATSIAAASPASTIATGGVRQVKPVRCGRAEFGQTGQYNGIAYICSDRRQNGELYAVGYFYWRPA